MSTVEAAALIRRIIDDKMASAIRKEVTLRGYRPTDFTLFAFGGGGPTHAAGYMGEIPRAVMFPFSPVFCAYGSSIMDVVHLYERSHRMMLLAPLTGQPALDRDAFNGLVRELMDEARREVEAEGLSWDDATVSLELDCLYGGQIHSKRASSPMLFVESDDDVRDRLRALRAGVQRGVQPARGQRRGGVYIDTFVLRVAIPGQQLELPELETADGDATPAEHAAGVLRRLGRHAGVRVRGAAARPQHRRPGDRPGGLHDAVIPPGRRFHIENHGLGILEDD